MDFKSLVTLAVLSSSAAHAQFSNTQLGVGPLINSVIGQGPQYGGFVEVDRYLESGFEVFARAPVLIVETSSGADTQSGRGRVFGTGLSLGTRYLFLQEAWRPWVGVQLSGSVLITTPKVSWFLGAGASAGLDWVFDDSLSLGVRASYDAFIDLNAPWRHQLGLMLALHVLL